jgi:SLT domain-containing protein
MAQNQMEDSRIPVWMINAETTLPTGGDMQMIISEGKSSHFSGLGNSSTTAIGATPQYTSRNTGAEAFTEHANGDRGHAFVMKGTDTITGFANGFLNVAPALVQSHKSLIRVL